MVRLRFGDLLRWLLRCSHRGPIRKGRRRILCSFSWFWPSSGDYRELLWDAHSFSLLTDLLRRMLRRAIPNRKVTKTLYLALWAYNLNMKTLVSGARVLRHRWTPNLLVTLLKKKVSENMIQHSNFQRNCALLGWSTAAALPPSQELSRESCRKASGRGDTRGVSPSDCLCLASCLSWN